MLTLQRSRFSWWAKAQEGSEDAETEAIVLNGGVGWYWRETKLGRDHWWSWPKTESKGAGSTHQNWVEPTMDSYRPLLSHFISIAYKSLWTLNDISHDPNKEVLEHSQASRTKLLPNITTSPQRLQPLGNRRQQAVLAAGEWQPAVN